MTGLLSAATSSATLAASPAAISGCWCREAEGAVFFSVGPEPAGVPEPIIHVSGGPARFVEFLHGN